MGCLCRRRSAPEIARTFAVDLLSPLHRIGNISSTFLICAKHRNEQLPLRIYLRLYSIQSAELYISPSFLQHPVPPTPASLALEWGSQPAELLQIGTSLPDRRTHTTRELLTRTAIGFKQSPTTCLVAPGNLRRRAAHKCNSRTLTSFANDRGHHAVLPPGPTWIEVLLANPRLALLFLDCDSSKVETISVRASNLKGISERMNDSFAGMAGGALP